MKLDECFFPCLRLFTRCLSCENLSTVELDDKKLFDYRKIELKKGFFFATNNGIHDFCFRKIFFTNSGHSF